MSGLTKDDVMGMALEAGLGSGRGVIQITKFAALVATAEREACAKVCDERAAAHPMGSDEQCEAEDCAAAIRARGQQDNG